MAPTEPQGPRADVCVFSVPFWNPTYDEFKQWWDWTLDNAPSARLLELANPNTLNIAYKNPRFMEILRKADANVNDGVGIRIASKMRGVETRYNFAGTDLMPRLFEEAHREIRVFFFGATEESNRIAVEKITERYKRVVCAGRINGFCDPVKDALPMIAKSSADVLMCALGQPKQEFFMAENLAALNVKVAVTCGGMFDFFSETKPRAPLWMRKIACEWVYRLSIEPKRMFKRYVVGNPVFLWRALVTRSSDLKCAAESSSARRSIEAQN
ncbi:MAG TPA: WecB/TagA/CpsF family glycosyltransferase [Fimbriimonadaceae bacterium]|nr:WecB/TagA/CpsF family glycosyltransferase [Fimbriimonadaceae bacterium]